MVAFVPMSGRTASESQTVEYRLPACLFPGHFFVCHCVASSKVYTVLAARSISLRYFTDFEYEAEKAINDKSTLR